MASHQFLLQMAGSPGSGKSSLGRMIGRVTRAVVLDKDVLKSATLEAGATEELARRVAYDVFFSLADHLLGQGWSVVLDSPSFWETIPRRGSEIAEARLVPYFFIECICNDRDELQRRLESRERMHSQPGPEILAVSWQTKPPPSAHLRVDTTKPLEDALTLALEYLGWGDQASLV